jgi:hypothetical protein
MARFNPALIGAGANSTAKYQKTVIALLRERHAVQRTAAQPLPELSSWQRRRVDQLVDRGVLRVAEEGRYYVDEEALREWHARQRAIAFAVIVVSAGIGAAWLLAA